MLAVSGFRPFYNNYWPGPNVIIQAPMILDINCDMGEGIGNDEQLMPYISSANIACGYHAGNMDTMWETSLLALKHGVRIGAHPSFPDRENFGRSEMSLAHNDIYELIIQQLILLNDIVLELGS